MQTIKTAAIFVLLMSVIYGGYVSLTTPPEALPPEMVDMLAKSDQTDFGIEAALPPSLGELDISTGTPADVGSTAGGSFDANLAFPGSDPEFSGNTIEASPVSADLGSTQSSGGSDSMGSGFATSLSDTPGTQLQSSNGLVSATLTDNATSLGQGSRSDAGTAAKEYPTTDRTFVMPDPNKLGDSPFGTPSDSASGTSVAQVAAIDTKSSADRALATSPEPNLGLANAVRTADRQYQADQRKEALATLSIFYNTPNLSGEQRRELLSRLDPLAADVIYSRKHLLEKPYRVGANETLVQIAEQFKVPWQLLANINQVQDPVTVLPGTELKVVRGPFRAEVSLKQQEITLFLGDLYAGRFPIGVGNDPAPQPGTFTVQDKQESKTFYDATGAAVAPGSPTNPYGNAWIDLGGQLCIHGSPSTTNPTEKGCISLAADYADDLYGILSQGSTVTIRR